MQKDSETNNYHYKVEFPLLQAYDVQRVVDLIVESACAQLFQYPEEKLSWPEYRKWTISQQSVASKDFLESNTDQFKDDVCVDEAGINAAGDEVSRSELRKNLYRLIFLTDQKAYIFHQLLKAVNEEKVDFWNWSTRRKIDTTELLKIFELLKKPPPTIRSTYSMLVEPESVEIPSLPTEYRFALIAAGQYQLTKAGLIAFCREICVLANFQGESMEGNASEVSKTNIETAQECIATAQDLSVGFKRFADVKKNEKWFNERCSNINKYPKFKEALAVRGKKGRGNYSKFKVTLIALILYDELKSEGFISNPRKLLRARIEKNWPEAVVEFDMAFSEDED